MLDATGSDFATGNIHRFNRTHEWPAAFVRKTFWRGRRRTHVTHFRWLLHDRMAQNKLWRRSFWDEHALRFPEGCLHEDIPVVIPAHFMARSVDVVSAPVYLYREREDGSSITQHRAALRTLDHRVAACEHVRDYLEHSGPPGARRWYDETLVSDDLRYHLDVLRRPTRSTARRSWRTPARSWRAPALAWRTACRRCSGTSGGWCARAGWTT